jgi:tripartite-type tricarboxylate transporter receptor subunit TctC
MTNLNKIRIACVAIAASFVFSMPAFAEVNFAGKTIEWNIPFSEKGGSAKWANFFAPLLSEALPGNPTVVVKYRPGAGSTKGANWFQQQKNGDGTVIFGTSGSTHFPYLLGDPRVKYEITDWVPVMATGTGGVAYINAEDGKKLDGSANALKDGNYLFGSQGATRLDLIPLLAWKMLGMNVEPVFGIKSRGDGRLMFERGEANVDYQTSAAYLKASAELVKEGKAVPMMTWGSVDTAGNIIRDPTFPEMPTFKEVCEKTSGCSTSGESWDAWKGFFNAGFPVQKIVFLPTGTDQEIVDTYVKAFTKIRDRSDFIKISEKRLGKYPMFVGAEVDAAVAAATTVPPAAKAFVIKWLADDYGTQL